MKCKCGGANGLGECLCVVDHKLVRLMANGKVMSGVLGAPERRDLSALVSAYDKLREAAKDFIAGEITVGEFEAVIYGCTCRDIKAPPCPLHNAVVSNFKIEFINGYSVQPDNSLMDKVKVCSVCQYPGDNHFEHCKRNNI